MVVESWAILIAIGAGTTVITLLAALDGKPRDNGGLAGEMVWRLSNRDDG